MTPDPVRDALIRIAKDYMACNNALILLLIEKGVLADEDIKRLLEIKLGQLATMDQLEAKSLDALFKKRSEDKGGPG